MSVVYRNTRHVAGEIIEVTPSLETNTSRKVSVKLTKAEKTALQDLGDAQGNMYADDVPFSHLPKLKVQVISDTFAGGVVGKLVNLAEVMEAYFPKEGGN